MSVTINLSDVLTHLAGVPVMKWDGMKSLACWLMKATMVIQRDTTPFYVRRGGNCLTEDERQLIVGLCDDPSGSGVVNEDDTLALFDLIPALLDNLATVVKGVAFRVGRWLFSIATTITGDGCLLYREAV